MPHMRRAFDRHSLGCDFCTTNGRFGGELTRSPRRRECPVCAHSRLSSVRIWTAASGSFLFPLVAARLIAGRTVMARSPASTSCASRFESSAASFPMEHSFCVGCQSRGCWSACCGEYRPYGRRQLDARNCAGFWTPASRGRHLLQRPASKKRQGTKSRGDWRGVRAAGAMGI